MASPQLQRPAARDYSTDQARWDAVRQRDPEADGHFVFSVKTTGVYCRPSCPARLPNRNNVAFHAHGAAAEACGFRACKRCRPNGPSLAERHTSAVRAAMALIDRAEELPSLDALADTAGLSRHHFHRVFKRVTGLTPGAYARARRARRLREDLTENVSVTEAMYAAGYSGSSQFYREARDHLGMPPGAYRQRGRNQRIRFAVGECFLGSILVAATDNGVCAIEFGDEPEPLVRALEARFRNAELIGDDPGFAGLVARVIGALQSPGLWSDVALDIQGTAFQHQVWQALRAIPPGQTASYADIARSIGAPHAHRAVAGACAANTLAVAIPCHRVVRADGSLSGYRWGVERKRALLARERAAT